MSELYALKNIRRRFGSREVLHIPALSLDCGKIYALLGPNGAGKTTLMRILAFMDTPTEGEIVFMGEKIRPDQAARYRARVVWVPQSPVMFTGSLLYNIEYPMRLKGVGREERTAKAMALLESVDLIKLAKAPAHRLSGGEAQRASIARALAAGAEVILFDEPTASVDFRSRGEIIGIIRELREKRGLSVIVTTHDAALAAELCQERITLFDGQLVPQLPGLDLSSSSSSVKQPPYGLPGWPGRLREGHERLELALSPEALTGFSGREPVAALASLAEQNAGFFLRLRLSPPDSEDATIDVFLPMAENADLARKLHLGNELVLQTPKN